MIITNEEKFILQFNASCCVDKEEFTGFVEGVDYIVSYENSRYENDSKFWMFVLPSYDESTDDEAGQAIEKSIENREDELTYKN